jgi:hypothetical protein
MATYTWKQPVASGVSTPTLYGTAAAWGGVVPGVADTAVITSAGDGTPADNPYTFILSPHAGSSAPYLTSKTLTLYHSALVQDPTNKSIDYYSDPLVSSVPLGQTIDPAVLDLVGAGSEAALVLQRSTIAAATVTRVSGDAYMYAGYTNLLKGNIQIGLPFSVNGKPVTSTTTDANGFKNALYIDVQDYGSWVAPLTPDSYVPGVTSSGTISIAAASALLVSVAGNAQTIQTVRGVTVEQAAAVSAFTNTGTIHVEAGGTLHVTAYGGKGELINRGSITVAGHAGDNTVALVQAVVEGAGTWTLSGGTAAAAASTGAIFGNNVTGGTIRISDATLRFLGGSGVSDNNIVVSEGTIGFVGTGGVMEIDTGDLQTAYSVFSDTITGFAPTDTILLEISVLPGDTLTLNPTWVAGTNGGSLLLSAVSGSTSTPEALFKLDGKYAGGLSDFSIKSVLTSSGLYSVTITTSASQAAAPPLSAGDWSVADGLGSAGDTSPSAGLGLSVDGGVPSADSVAAFGHFDWAAAAHPACGVVMPHLAA